MAEKILSKDSPILPTNWSLAIAGFPALLLHKSPDPPLPPPPTTDVVRPPRWTTSSRSHSPPPAIGIVRLSRWTASSHSQTLRLLRRPRLRAQHVRDHRGLSRLWVLLLQLLLGAVAALTSIMSFAVVVAGVEFIHRSAWHSSTPFLFIDRFFYQGSSRCCLYQSSR